MRRTRRVIRASLALALLGAAASARAQDTTATPPVVTTDASPPVAPARVPSHDPQADRGVLMPTAYTHPRGTLYVSDYELVLFQIGYAFTDDTQLTLTGTPRLGDEDIELFDLTLKTSLYRGELLRVAALGSASGGFAAHTSAVAIGRAGGVAQLCLEARCEDSVSMSSNVVLAGTILMATGVSGIIRVFRPMSLLLEVDSLVPLGNVVDGLGGTIGGGGLRFHWPHWGFDVALMRVFGHDKSTLPFFALTYRT